MSQKMILKSTPPKGSKNLPEHYNQTGRKGHRKSSGPCSGCRRTSESGSECCLPPCKKTTRESVNEGLGFERAQKLTYLGWCFRCRDSRRSQFSTDKVHPGQSILLLLLLLNEVRHEHRLRGWFRNIKNELGKVMFGENKVRAVHSHSPWVLHQSREVVR